MKYFLKIIYFYLLILIENYLVFGRDETLEYKKIQCLIEIDHYHECIQFKKSYRINQICHLFHSNKCQEFYQKYFDNPFICPDVDEKMKNEYNLRLKLLVSSLKFLCTKNVNGKYCPLSRLLYSQNNFNLNSFDKHHIKILHKYMNETCHSEKYIESYFDYMDKIEQLSKEFNSLIDMVKLLKESTKLFRSDNFTYNVIYPKLKINTTINKYNSVLIIISGLLLSILI